MHSTVTKFGKFTGVTQIGIAGVIIPDSNPTGLQNAVAAILRSKGWNVVRVAAFGNQLTAVVVGSTSDNLTTVAATFQRQLSAAGIDIRQTVAQFTKTGVNSFPNTAAQQSAPQVINTGGNAAPSNINDLLKPSNKVTGITIATVSLVVVLGIVLLQRK